MFTVFRIISDYSPHNAHGRRGEGRYHVFRSKQLTSGQGILKDLLEAQELEHTQVNGGVESQSSLVRTQCTVELDSVAAVDLYLVLVVFPDNAELDDAFGDRGDL